VLWKAISAGIYEGIDAGLVMEEECSKALADSKGQENELHAYDRTLRTGLL
jgi:hypothetical protein